MQKNISVNVIAIGPGGEDAPLAQRKWIDAASADAAANYIAIYGTRCAMISRVKEDYPTAVIIESAAVSRALGISFDTLWNLLPAP